MKADRKAYLRSYQKEWLKKRRQDWFSKNGPCKKCGSWEKLELDHIDPSTKTASQIWSWKESRRTEELLKCQVLCEQCHLEKTKIDLKKMNTQKPFPTRRLFSKKEIFNILDDYYKHKISRRKIAGKLKVSQGSISHIIYGTAYHNYKKEYDAECPTSKETPC